MNFSKSNLRRPTSFFFFFFSEPLRFGAPFGFPLLWPFPHLLTYLLGHRSCFHFLLPFTSQLTVCTPSIGRAHFPIPPFCIPIPARSRLLQLTTALRLVPPPPPPRPFGRLRLVFFLFFCILLCVCVSVFFALNSYCRGLLVLYLCVVFLAFCLCSVWPFCLPSR